MEIAIIPRFIINRLHNGDMERIHINVMLTSVLIMLVLFFWEAGTFLSSIPHFCLFERLLNIPCPGCGVTGSFLALGRFDLASAWGSNPAGVLLFFYLFLQIPLRIVALKFRTIQTYVFVISKIGGYIVLTALILVWIFRLIA